MFESAQNMLARRIEHPGRCGAATPQRPSFSPASSPDEWCPEPDEERAFHINDSHAKLDPESETEHDLDNYLADALAAEINAIEDSYTTVFGGDLPWDVFS